ncbi:TetR/AcrR family transcriptional regulator [Paraburkholderia tropica]|uniref:TetR/AcrR family transcriptional regulator n=1 Tax=Paraburkholderia tropica TaxID=92647 RepID=UPI002AB60899|nr:TetR family transcriptional regulator [Paraburkholderia tropica]
MLEDRLDAKGRLVQAAMRFFAERGIAGVAMHEISAAAGNRNKSAIAYHFNGRDGLVQAIQEEFSSFLKPRFDKELGRLEQSRKDRFSLYEIGLAVNAPFFALYASPGGDVALKTMARLNFEKELGGGLYHDALISIFNRVEALVLLKVPAKSQGQLKFHLAHYLMATVNGLALTERWTEEDFRDDPDLLLELMLSYNDYVTGGLAGTDHQRPVIDYAYWRDAITYRGAVE